MDIRMPGMDGIEATRRLLAHGLPTRVLVLTTFDVDEYVYEAMQAGASAFLHKTAPPRQLAEAVRTIAAGDALLAPSVTRRIVEQFVRRPAPGLAVPRGLEDLTGRELEVLRLLARARSNAEIAGELVVSEATVKSHVNRILGKLGLRDRAQAIVLAYETGLVEPGAATEAR
jgi:DNA-binding NarL/FixJ family response regulator